MRQYDALDLGGLHQPMAITRMGRGKQIGPQGREHLPVSTQGVDIPIGNATFKVGGQIVQIFRLAGIDIARNIQVVVVGGNLESGTARL